MHILYIHQYFATPFGTTGTRSYEFARRWVANGHKVTILTSIAQLTKEDTSDARGRFIKRFQLQGIDVLALNISYKQQMSMARRCWAFLAFLILSSIVAMFVKKVDIIYATSTPLTIAIPALTAKWLKRKKLVFEVRDQWPEIPIQLGIIKNKILIKILLWLEKTIYKNSTAIVAGSPGQLEGIRKVCHKDKPLEVISNCCNVEMFRPDIDGSAIRGKHGWKNKFIFLHAGAMGKVNSLDFIIDTAVKLKYKPDVLFVLLGEGNQKPVLQRRVEELDLKNVDILPAVPKQKLPEYFAAADAGLVIIGNFPIIEHNSANKFFDSLSAGKPVLLNYSGWQRKILEDNNAGLGCKLYDIDDFVDKVHFLISDKKRIVVMGKNARKVAEENFNGDKLAAQVLSVIEKTFS